MYICMHVQDVRTVVSIDIFLYLLLDCLNSCQRIRVTAYIHTYIPYDSFFPNLFTSILNTGGHKYWYNASTGVSTWDRPAGFQ